MTLTIDLFCGGGGSSWGARAAGATIVGAVDGWDLAVRTFEDNFSRTQVLHRTLHRRSNSRILTEVAEADLLLASPECTNHTCARGSLDRDEASRETALYVLNYAKAFRPRWIVIENVVQMRGWARYGELLEALAVNYHVRPQVLDAADFGVPQSRRRLFILCDSKQEPPDLTKLPPCRTSTVLDILDPPGTWPAKPLRSVGRAQETLNRAARGIGKLGEGKPFLLVYYSSDGGGGWQTLDRPLRTMTTLDRFGLIEWRGREPFLRMLQVPELQRAMGFPSSYKLLQGSRRDRIKLLGNGVCPPVMQAIVSALGVTVDGKLPKPVLAPTRSFADHFERTPAIIRNQAA